MNPWNNFSVKPCLYAQYATVASFAVFGCVAEDRKVTKVKKVFFAWKSSNVKNFERYAIPFWLQCLLYNTQEVVTATPMQ